IGMRDIEENKITIVRRDTLEKSHIKINSLVEEVPNTLEMIQANLYEKANKYRQENTHTVETYDELKEVINNNGFAYAHWDGTAETEEKIKNETKATIRCIPFDGPDEDGICVYSGKPSTK